MSRGNLPATGTTGNVLLCYGLRCPCRPSEFELIEQIKSVLFVLVAVVEKSDFFKRYGLTENAVRTKVEMQLRRNGVRIIGRKERIVRQSWLYVYLRLMEAPSRHHFEQVDELSGSLNIFLRQKVELLGTPGDSKRRFCTATTWDTGGIVIWGTTQIEEGLDETIEILVEKFSKDYLDANPKDQASVPVRGEH